MSVSLRTTLGALALVVTTFLAGCERPPVDPVQTGFRGVAMETVYNPRTVAKLQAANVPPPTTDPAPTAGPKAGAIYQNVQVLGDLSVAEFNRHMASITAWVSPKEGCAYCHVGENFADDGKYTKIVARRMIQMTQHVNVEWKDHVAATGVTCWTCHRGQAVPANIWFKNPEPDRMRNFLGGQAGQNQASPMVGGTSLPYDPFTSYLQGDQKIRVNGVTALPTDHVASIKDTEGTFGLMIHMSTSLGVNCTYCHNTRSIHEWKGASPTRATAWYGIRMARDLNNDYLEGLTKTFPANRLGPTGDVAKINCATCHQGVFKPVYGAQMAKNYAGLVAAAAPAATEAAPMVTEPATDPK